MNTEAVEQPNSKQVLRRSAVTCEARRGLWSAGCGGFWEGWIVGACVAIQSSWPVLRWRRQSFRALDCSGSVERKRANALGGLLVGAQWRLTLRFCGSFAGTSWPVGCRVNFGHDFRFGTSLREKLCTGNAENGAESVNCGRPDILLPKFHPLVPAEVRF